MSADLSATQLPSPPQLPSLSQAIPALSISEFASDATPSSSSSSSSHSSGALFSTAKGPDSARAVYDSVVPVMQDILDTLEVQAAPELGLAYEWTMYFDDASFSGLKTKNFSESMLKVASFSSIQDFWRVYNYISSKLDAMPESYNLRLFHSNVKPMWEDAANINGGKWVIRKLNNKGSLASTEAALHSVWFEAVLAAVGDQLPAEAAVVGSVLSFRAKKREVQLWAGRAPPTDEAERQIESELRIAMQLGSDVEIEFVPHRDTMSRRKYAYTPQQTNRKSAAGAAARSQSFSWQKSPVQTAASPNTNASRQSSANSAASPSPPPPADAAHQRSASVAHTPSQRPPEASPAANGRKKPHSSPPLPAASPPPTGSAKHAQLAGAENGDHPRAQSKRRNRSRGNEARPPQNREGPALDQANVTILKKEGAKAGSPSGSPSVSSPPAPPVAALPPLASSPSSSEAGVAAPSPSSIPDDWVEVPRVATPSAAAAAHAPSTVPISATPSPRGLDAAAEPSPTEPSDAAPVFAESPAAPASAESPEEAEPEAEDLTDSHAIEKRKSNRKSLAKGGSVVRNRRAAPTQPRKPADKHAETAKAPSIQDRLAYFSKRDWAVIAGGLAFLLSLAVLVFRME